MADATTNRALGDKHVDVCIDPRDEIVSIDMAKLATDTTPYTDIEAEMAKAKLRKPEYPVNYAQHCERKAITHTPTTDSFMQVLASIEALPDPVWYDDSLAGLDNDWPANAYHAPTVKPVEAPVQPAKKVMTVVKWGEPYYGLTMKLTSDGRTEYNKWARMDKVTVKERRDTVWFVNHWDGKYAQVVNIAQTERRLVVMDAKQIASWFTSHKLSCGFSIDADKLETLKPAIAVYHAKWRTYEVNSLLSETLDKEYASRMATIAGNALYGDSQPTRL